MTDTRDLYQTWNVLTFLIVDYPLYTEQTELAQFRTNLRLF